MFVVEIPWIRKDTYFYYKIVPLPISRKIRILITLPKNPYLITKGLKANSLSTLSKAVDYGITQTILPIEDTCILYFDLMRYSNDVFYVQIPIELEEIKVESLRLNRWIVYTKSPVDLTRSRANEIIHHTRSGTNLLTIDNKCEYKIANYCLRGL